MPEMIFDGSCQIHKEELAELDLLPAAQLPVKLPREVKTRGVRENRSTEI